MPAIIKYLRVLCITAVCALCSLNLNAESLFVIGNLAVSDGGWDPSRGIELTFDGTRYSGFVNFQPYGSDTHSYFAIVESLGAHNGDWSAKRYGATDPDFDVNMNQAMTLNDNSNSWKVAGGVYNVIVDLESRTITVWDFPENLYVLGNLAVSNGGWNPSQGAILSGNGNGVYSSTVTFAAYGEDTSCYFSICTTLGADSNDWDGVGARYGAAVDQEEIALNTPVTLNNGSNAWAIAPGEYTVTVDLAAMTITVATQAVQEPEPEEPGNEYPDELFVVGNLAVSDGGWDVRRGICLTRNGTKYSGTVEFQGYNNEPTSYFTFISKLGYYAGDDWTTVNTGSRYGAASNNTQVTTSASIVEGSSDSWSISSGTYNVTVDLAARTVTVSAPEAAHGQGSVGGWPAEYEGVMLQSFYWDCYQNGWSWDSLSAQADDICHYFDIMWIPNFANCDVYGAGGMGYHPVNWFTNFTSAFGSESAFYNMMNAYKSRGMNMMAEVVINHRYQLPAETWRGKTWQIGNDGIPNNDRPNPGTGNPDTGSDWELCPDLDHTNANVQANVKAYQEMLCQDLGFAGFRYDFMVGFAPEFIKIYNRHSVPTYSVGEYWDENRARVASWINGTAYQSAAFDFPLKYAINDAFGRNDMTYLADASLADYGYGRYAVTFVDNHDTANEAEYRFKGSDDQISAANAYILSMPGTPCIFMPHWTARHDQIKELVNARKSAGVTNTSSVTLLRCNKNCFMAEVTGKYGKLVVKVGPELVSPEGYTDNEIVTSGNQYCIWIKGGNNVDYPEPEDPQTVVVPARLYIIGNIVGSDWNTANTPALVKNGNVYRNESPIKFATNPAFFSFITSLGETWDDVNEHDRIAPSLIENSPILKGQPTPFNIYSPSTSIVEAKSWELNTTDADEYGYNVLVDFAKKQITIDSAGNSTSSLEIEISAYQPETPIYYNVYGVRINDPQPGIYIEVIDGKARKVSIK